MTCTTLPQPALAGAPEVVAQMSALAGDLSEVLWAARDDGEKMDTFVMLDVVKSRIESVQLDLVRELEATKGVQALGWASTADFVTAVSGGTKSSGPASVRLAEELAQPVLTPVAEALADGWLSRDKAQVISRGIDLLPHNSGVKARGVQVLLDEAKRLDATELRKAARRLVEVVDPEGEERRAEKDFARDQRAAHLKRYLAVTDDGAGGAFIRGRCSAEDAALVRSTLLPLSRPVPKTVPDCDPSTCEVPGCSHDGRDPRDHGARMLDALVEACNRLQKAGVLPESHGAQPRVNITIDLEDLKRHGGYGTTDTGEDLTAETVRRMACDADLIPVVLGADSAVLDVGRTMRLVTAAIWYALVVRDRHCRFPGCTRPPVMTHAHHVVHWIDGGSTSLDNLVLLCGHHHRLVHAGPWTIDQPSPGRFEFTPPDAVRRARGPRPDRAPPTG